MTETILVVGSTGNMGFAAVTAALRTKRNVLAVVRNEASADKLIKYIGSDEGITTVIADVLSDTGLKEVVDQVRAGKLPAFQHVWSSGAELLFIASVLQQPQAELTCTFLVGGEYIIEPIEGITTERLRKNMTTGFESNFFAYRATIGYLLEQNNPSSTWTICTGSQGDLATHVLPAMTQGALFPFCKAAARENENTNVRFNEVYLCYRVENDADAVVHGVTRSSDFGKVYEMLLDATEVRSSRIMVEDAEGDLAKLRHHKKN